MKSPFGWSHQGPQKRQIENNPLAQPLFRRNVEERDFEPGQLEYVRRGFEPYTDQDQYCIADGYGNVTVFATVSATTAYALPSAGPSVGLIYRVVRTDGAATLSLQAASGNIDGAVSASVSAYVSIQSDGTNWWTVSRG